METLEVAVSPHKPRRAFRRTKTITTSSTALKRLKTKLKPISKLKKELDKVFSIYIRQKYLKVCYTCKASGKTLQCGHFISRQYLSTRWEEDNCRPQCVGCNIWGRGKLLDFEEHLKEELGDVRVEEMKNKRHQLMKPTRQFYEERIAYFTSLL